MPDIEPVTTVAHYQMTFTPAELREFGRWWQDCPVTIPVPVPRILGAVYQQYIRQEHG